MADKHTNKKIAGLFILAAILFLAAVFTSWYTFKNWNTLNNAGPLSVLGMLGAIIAELGLLVFFTLKAMDLSMKRD